MISEQSNFICIYLFSYLSVTVKYFPFALCAIVYINIDLTCGVKIDKLLLVIISLQKNVLL